MEKRCKKGDRVVLTDNCNQIFLGVVKSLNQELGRILLSDIVQLPDNKAIIGYRNFDKNEIQELKIYNPDITGETKVLKAQEPKPIQKPEIDDLESKTKQNEKSKNGYCYISKLGSSFYSAIATLKTCNKIGLYGLGTSKGRCERAVLIAISTPSTVFIFDIKTLGDNAFLKGLKEILESSSIIKVVHDCRLLSDCLKHRHTINLEGVRDVEAEDIMVVYQERKMIRKHRRSVEYLLKLYLGLEMGGLEKFEDLWTQRPLPSNQLSTLAVFVSSLIPLQEAIQNKYLQKLIDASTVYNTHMRNLDFFEFLHHEPTNTLKTQMIRLAGSQIEPQEKCSSK